MRLIKIKMNMKEGKVKVMKNLKGTVDDFRRISVTDDYTKSEREKLRKWNTEAKKKSQSGENYDY